MGTPSAMMGKDLAELYELLVKTDRVREWAYRYSYEIDSLYEEKMDRHYKQIEILARRIYNDLKLGQGL